MKIASVIKLKDALKFSSDQGSNFAVMTTQDVVRVVLTEVEQLDELNKKYFMELELLQARAELWDWLKANVDEINFIVIVPKKILCTNPWIAIGENFEGAVAQAKEQLAKCRA